MIPVRLLLLPIVLPAALWACGPEPGPDLVRVQGRAMLFAEPASAPALPPPGPAQRGCHGRDGKGAPGPEYIDATFLLLAHRGR